MRSMLTIAATAALLAAAPAIAAPVSDGGAMKAAADTVAPVQNAQFYFGFGAPGWGYGPGYGYGYRPYYRPYGYGYRYRPYYRGYRRW